MKFEANERGGEVRYIEADQKGREVVSETEGSERERTV